MTGKTCVRKNSYLSVKAFQIAGKKMSWNSNPAGRALVGVCIDLAVSSELTAQEGHCQSEGLHLSAPFLGWLLHDATAGATAVAAIARMWIWNIPLPSSQFSSGHQTFLPSPPLQDAKGAHYSSGTKHLFLLE